MPFVGHVQLIWKILKYANSVNLTRNYSRFRTICPGYDITGNDERIDLHGIANSQVDGKFAYSQPIKTESFSLSYNTVKTDPAKRQSLSL